MRSVLENIVERNHLNLRLLREPDFGKWIRTINH